MRHMDYGVQINKLMYTRLLKGEDITLFSPSDVPGLMTRSFADQDEFERLYTKYEKDDSIRKQRVKAVDLFSLMMQERASTGRIMIRTLTTATPTARLIRLLRQCASLTCARRSPCRPKPLEDVNDETAKLRCVRCLRSTRRD